MIEADPGALNSAAGQLASASGELSSVLSGLDSAYQPLDSWQGDGSSEFDDLYLATRSHLVQGQAALDMARQGVYSYARIVEEALHDWEQADVKEAHLKDELVIAHQKLAALQQEVTDLQVKLMTIPPVTVGVSAPSLVNETSGVTSALAALGPVVQRMQTEIADLDRQVQAQEHLKQEFEDLVKKASADVSQTMQEAQNIWPSVNSAGWPGGEQFLGGCVAGYTPPAQGDGGSGILGWIATAVVIVATIPLDETGGGEIIDGIVADGVDGAAADGGGAAAAASDASDVSELEAATPGSALRVATIGGRMLAGGVANVGISDLLSWHIDTNPGDNIINFVAGALPWAAPTRLLTRTIPFTEAIAQGGSTAAIELNHGQPLDAGSIVLSTAEGFSGGLGDSYGFHLGEEAKSLRESMPLAAGAPISARFMRRVDARISVVLNDAHTAHTLYRVAKASR